MLFKGLVAATLFAAAMALPSSVGDSGSSASDTTGINTLGEAADQCGDDQVLSCCDSGSTTDSDNGLLDGVLGGSGGGLLGGQCDPLDVTVLGIDVPISSACQDQVACCSGNTDGLVDLECTSLEL